MTKEQEIELLDRLVKEIDKRTRFDQMNNLIDLPSKEEKIAALLDTISDINVAPPRTSYKLDNMWEATDPRLERLVVQGASVLVLDTLIYDWTANGVDASIDEFDLPSRLADFKDLMSTIMEQFEKNLGRLKITNTRVLKGRNYQSSGGYNRTSYYTNSSRILKSLKSGTGRLW